MRLCGVDDSVRKYGKTSNKQSRQKIAQLKFDKDDNLAVRFARFRPDDSFRLIAVACRCAEIASSRYRFIARKTINDWIIGIIDSTRVQIDWQMLVSNAVIDVE